MKKKVAIEFIDDLVDITTKNEQAFDDYYMFGIISDNYHTPKFLEHFENEHINIVQYRVFMLTNPNIYPSFSDFGFISSKKAYYLYEDLAIPFSVNISDKKQVAAVLEQIEEHLIAYDKVEGEIIYFVERYHKQLIEGISNVYQVNVHFY